MPTGGNENYKAGGGWIIGSKERDLDFLKKAGIY
jgi:hypothetical protein